MRLSEMVKLLEEILAYLHEMSEDRKHFRIVEDRLPSLDQVIKEVSAAIKEAKDAQTGGEKLG